ncbi:VLRF1 family aeRF1-type release factor [Desulfothermobacter acidiphilus]|uniref:VLRF1 family aeRF1-type release factor n=1 Tax=Desulfothermobacter acidiphilus TaxID=1938353 RepID=UPI003F8A91EE
MQVDRGIIAQLLATERDDILSIYLNVDPTRPENQTSPPAYRIWLKNALDQLEEELSPSLPRERRLALRELREEVLHYVNTYLPRGRSLVLFVADGFRQELSLMARVNENYLHYGRPDVTPLLWLLEEYEPVGIVLADSFQARFLSAHLGKAAVREEAELTLDTTTWPRYDLRAPTARGAHGAHIKGSNVDAFEDRLAEKVAGFWREIAERITKWVEEEKFSYLLLGGEDKAIAGIMDYLPPEVARKVADRLVAPLYESEHEILLRAKPQLAAAERRKEEELTRKALDAALSGGLGAVGPAEVLNTLREGRVRTLIITWPVKGEVFYCRACNFFFPEERSRCPACGGEVVKGALREIIPRLAFHHRAEIELVTGEPAQSLAPYGGMAALLRY